MKVVVALSYYVPYTSGLTNVARDIAEGLARHGHEVTVVTNQHDPTLPAVETINGVRVLRTRVAVRLGKGVLSPTFVSTVVREAVKADVVHVHAPMLEAGPLMWSLKRRTSARRVLTYHCDVDLRKGVIDRLQQAVLDRSHAAGADRATTVIVTSEDYARSSRISNHLLGHHVVIPPGCHDRAGGLPAFRETAGQHVGFLGRIVEEKGIAYLVDGFTRLRDPDARLLIGGDFTAIAGGSVIQQVRERIGTDDRIRVLGFIPEDRIPDFYASLDVFALTSVNSFEAFGIVQVEAMSAGVAVIASDLPGVRGPVADTGYGVIVPPRDPVAIADALGAAAPVARDRARMHDVVLERYGVDEVVRSHERLFTELRN